MKIGVVGLGKMGSNIAHNLLDNHVEVVGYDINDEVRKSVADQGIDVAHSLDALFQSLPERKTETGSSASSVLVLFLISEIDPPSDIVLSITSDSVCFVLFSYASDLPEPAEKSILIASDKV